MVFLTRKLLGGLRPKNWLDGLGLAVQIVSFAGWIDTIVHLPDYESGNGWLWQVLNVACFTLLFCGFVLRRVANKEPIFGQRRKPGS
jgi:hypothetical protein